MTTVTLFYCGAYLLGVKACGHTETAEAGEDLLCAAVSAITQTAVLGIKCHVGVPHAFECVDGYLFVMVDKAQAVSQLARVHDVFSTMRLGLLSMAEAYPQHLIIKERRD